jgi:alkylation response protein AidB-like acyl-CoA dehydrogenase
MDFAYSDEQRMLTDSLQRLMAEQWTYDQRRERFAAGTMNTQAWRQLAELGVTGLLVPPEFGGFGESPATMLAVHQVLGRGIVSEPVIASSVMATVMLDQSESVALREPWLQGLASGDSILTVAWQEPGERFQNAARLTQLVLDGSRYVLTGRKVQVWHAAASDAMIVSARLEGEMVLVLVPTDAAGVSIQDFPTFDLARCADVGFDAVALDDSAIIARGVNAERLFDLGLDYAITALCAHACGAMAYVNEITTNYLKTRKQFGQALINFQELQHRLADMLIEQEMAMSNAFVAAAALSDTNDALRSKRVSMAKNEVARAARRVGEEAVQLHGGMGVTDEYEVGDYFKRLVYVGVLLGDRNHHFERAQLLDVA